jgi:hypothetical protein
MTLRRPNDSALPQLAADLWAAPVCGAAFAVSRVPLPGRKAVRGSGVVLVGWAGYPSSYVRCFGPHFWSVHWLSSSERRVVETVKGLSSAPNPFLQLRFGAQLATEDILQPFWRGMGDFD